MEKENQEKQEKQENQEKQESGADGAHTVAVTDAYISQMSPLELSAHRIAKGHLGTSFNLKKSNGFLKWISKK
jgi:hypothetical protein